jgi:hypothetical protein
MKKLFTLLSLSLSLLCSVAMLAQQNPNCTDFELCFQKRVGAAGDTIIDVLLINPPDSIVGANFEVRMSAEAYGGQVFDVHSAFAAAGYSPTYIDNTFQDDVITFQRSVHLPILLSEDTVKLFSFTILAPAGVCIDLRFVDFARAFVSEDPGSPTECFPVTKCTANLCFPSVSIGGIILTLKESCTDTVTNNFGLRDIIVNVYQGSDTAPSCTKTTGSNGRYECILAPGYDYTFIPTPDDSVLVDTCGVNEVDILHIRQHILSISFLNHPYEIIAADASQDGMISTYDMVVLGGFLQGLWDLPKNWEIVEAGSYNALPDPIPAHLQPLGTVPPFDTSLTIINLPLSIPLHSMQVFSASKSGMWIAPARIAMRMAGLLLLIWSRSGNRSAQQRHKSFPSMCPHLYRSAAWPICPSMPRASRSERCWACSSGSPRITSRYWA